MSGYFKEAQDSLRNYVSPWHLEHENQGTHSSRVWSLPAARGTMMTTLCCSHPAPAALGELGATQGLTFLVRVALPEATVRKHEPQAQAVRVWSPRSRSHCSSVPYQFQHGCVTLAMGLSSTWWPRDAVALPAGVLMACPLEVAVGVNAPWNLSSALFGFMPPADSLFPIVGFPSPGSPVGVTLYN